MSNTPETEKVKAALHTNWHDLLNHARKLERERDEAREKVEQQRKEIVRLNGATNNAGGTPLKFALRERDEAISQIAQAECRAERFCQERDEAQDYSKDIWKILRHSQDEVLRLTFENRELSQSIEGWENKWKCAVEMAARAELERDDALDDAKEYHIKMVGLINERNDAREDAKLLSERLTALELQSTAELARLEQELINMKELHESNN